VRPAARSRGVARCAQTRVTSSRGLREPPSPQPGTVERRAGPEVDRPAIGQDGRALQLRPGAAAARRPSSRRAARLPAVSTDDVRAPSGRILRGLRCPRRRRPAQVTSQGSPRRRAATTAAPAGGRGAASGGTQYRRRGPRALSRPGRSQPGLPAGPLQRPPVPVRCPRAGDFAGVTALRTPHTRNRQHRQHQSSAARDYGSSVASARATRRGVQSGVLHARRVAVDAPAAPRRDVPLAPGAAGDLEKRSGGQGRLGRGL